MFIDKAKITIKAGKGGDGHVSFYRGKYVPNGGPDGGDGGDGGSVVFKADRNVTTLMDFRYKRAYEAQDGENGGKKNCFGKKGSDCIVRVPVGTVIREEKTGLVMADMHTDGMEKMLIKGGRGGRGNSHFATSVRQAPRYAERGKVPPEYNLELDLKLIADAGLVGLPNAGKSSLLAMVTNATPKIANYHFTTLTPNLGVVRNKYGNEFVLADIPGLIEGASEGAGLGHEFLGHVERTRVLIHIVDASASEGGDPMDFVDTINGELAAYSEALGKKSQIIAANKMDVPEAEEHYIRLKEAWEPKGVSVLPISAATGQGVQELMAAAWELLKDAPEAEKFEEEFSGYQEEVKAAPFFISMPNPGYFLVEGVGVEKMIGYTNLDTESGMAFFQKYLRDRGIIGELERMGAVDGDTVKIYTMEFDYYK